MENNSGKILKTIGIILGVLGAVCAFIILFTLGTEQGIGLSFGIFAGILASSLLSALMLYGFGELIDNTAHIRAETYEINARLSRLEAEKNAKAAAEVLPVENTEAAAAPQTAIKANMAAEEREIQMKIVNREIVPYEALGSAQEVYLHFCQAKQNGCSPDEEAMIARLNEVAKREENGSGNAKNNAISLLKSYYKHNGRVYSVDRSGSTFRCPACGNRIFSDRRSCHQCGALFRV